MFGENYSKIILNKKMALARKFLLGTKLPIKIIARKCGFANNQSFTKAFSKFHGNPPLSYARGKR